MLSDLASIGLFCLQWASLIGALAVLGYPIYRLVHHFSPRTSRAIVLPLYGLWPLMTASWLWSTLGSGGLHLLLPILTAVTLLIDLALFAASKTRVRLPWESTLLVVGSAAIFIVIFHSVLLARQTTVVTLGNLDLAQFATGAEHLRHLSLNDHGPEIGFDRGAALRADTTGTYFLALFPSTLWFTSVLNTINATLFVGVALGAAQIGRTLRLGFHTGRRVSIAVALLPMFTPLTFFCVVEGYLSQIWTGTLLIASVGVGLRMQRRRFNFGAALQLSIIISILWYLYPFAGLVVALLVWTPLAVTRFRKLLRSAAFIALNTLAAFALSAVLAPTRFSESISILITQGQANAGWPLPAFYPNEILGFTDAFDAHVFAEPDRVLKSLPLVTLGLIAALLVRRSVKGRIAVVVVAFVFGSYAVLYLYFGVSYQQWKWLALLTPMLICSFIVLLIAGMRELIRPRAVSALSAALIFSAGLLFVTYDRAMLAPALKGNNPALVLSPDIASAAADPRVRSHQPILINADTWTTMWLGAELSGVERVPPGFGYTKTIRKADTWRLESNSSPQPPTEIAESTKINSLISLVKRRSDTAASVNVKSISVSANVAHWNVDVTNLSDDTWRSPADDAARGFGLQATLVQAGPGQNYVQAFDSTSISVALPAGVSIEPNRSFTFSDDTALSEPNASALQFDPYRTDTGQYQQWTANTLAVLK